MSHIDLASLESVRNAAKQFLGHVSRLGILMLSAGIMAHSVALFDDRSSRFLTPLLVNENDIGGLN
jgi:NAD(P)-dependent dehydrogenase (short-subunit alcohol dehydrogenase family)